MADESLERLVQLVQARNPRALGRLITMFENADPKASDARILMGDVVSRGNVIGLTGAPGVGKSTLTSALIAEISKRGHTVGVLAVDPSSPISRGALLGDRLRMQEHATDPNVFIRSMASRGHLGGLAATADEVLGILQFAGFDYVLVETVGVGQSEVEIVDTADTVVVLLAPGMGDGIQAAKAGILEIGDIFVVNKADRDGARTTERELRAMISLSGHIGESWEPPVVRTVGITGEGIPELFEQILAHQSQLGG